MIDRARLISATLVTVLTPLTVASTTFMDIGDLRGGHQPVATAVSNNEWVVGYTGQFGTFRGFRWAPSVGMWELGPLPGGSQVQVNAVSSDGTIVVGISESGVGARAFLRSGVTIFALNLAGDISWSRAEAVTSNAGVYAVVACTAYVGGQLRAFRYYTNGSAATVSDLGLLPDGTSATSSDLSDNGEVVVGSAETPDGTRAYRWVAEMGMQDLGTLPGGFSSFAHASNGNGKVIVGTSGSANGSRAFRWSVGAGMRSLGTMPGHASSSAVDVNGCGNVVIGYSGGTPAFWTAAMGWVPLQPYLTDTLFLDLTGWVLTSVNAISEDGRHIVGTGTLNGVARSWVVLDMVYPDLGCPGDLDCDAEVTGADISVLLGFWGLAGKPLPAADITRDGIVDGADLAVLLGSWGPCQ